MPRIPSKSDIANGCTNPRMREATKPCCCCGCLSVRARTCDFPLAGAKTGKTCDRVLCEGCAFSVGANRDYCPAHARQSKTSGTGTGVLPSAGKTVVASPLGGRAPDEPPAYSDDEGGSR